MVQNVPLFPQCFTQKYAELPCILRKLVVLEVCSRSLLASFLFFFIYSIGSRVGGMGKLISLKLHVLILGAPRAYITGVRLVCLHYYQYGGLKMHEMHDVEHQRFK